MALLVYVMMADLCCILVADYQKSLFYQLIHYDLLSLIIHGCNMKSAFAFCWASWKLLMTPLHLTSFTRHFHQLVSQRS